MLMLFCYFRPNFFINSNMELRITVVGDRGVGKTCLLSTYTKNSFTEAYVPTVIGKVKFIVL